MTDMEPSFLQLCEEEFKDRYTERDEEFMKVKQADVKSPPIVDDNYEGRNRQDRGGHNQNWQRRGHDRDRHGGRDHYRDRSRGDHYAGAYRHQGYRF